MLPDPITVSFDLRLGQPPTTINANFKGKLGVTIFSTPTFDATQLDPSTLSLSGAPVSRTGNGKWFISTGDIDGDGRPDLTANFDGNLLKISLGDTLVRLSGTSREGRRIVGTKPVVVK
jgi:hypothetical protein